MSAEARLKELGLVLPVLPKPTANYLPYLMRHDQAFLNSGGRWLVAEPMPMLT